MRQGRRQGKSLEGAKLPRGSRGQRPLAGVQGAEPLGAKKTLFSAKIVIEALSEHVFPY